MNRKITSANYRFVIFGGCMKRKIFLMIIACSLLFVTGVGITTAIVHTAQHEILLEALTASQTKTMQDKLKRWGYYTGAVDGIYGPKTKAAVVAFQKKNKLVPDGIVGPKTLAALGMPTGSSGSNSSNSNSNSGSSSINNADLNLLARCVYSEARGEPYEGQVAVAAVVLNRVRHSDFPNSISGVIYQPWAFTAVHDGQINLTPNQSAYNAARDALNGWDPSYGCIYYYNPVTATSQWIFTRKTVTKIGRHVFAI